MNELSKALLTVLCGVALLMFFVLFAIVATGGW